MHTELPTTSIPNSEASWVIEPGSVESFSQSYKSLVSCVGILSGAVSRQLGILPRLQALDPAHAETDHLHSDYCYQLRKEAGKYGNW